MADGRTIKGKLAVRFAILLTGILVVAIGVYSVWSSNDQRLASEEKVLQEARLLSQQMSASWDYVDAVQDYINYNDDGRYDFKGIYCSVAGKSIALRFTQQTDCTIRYTRENPRTPTDAPDAFEAAALAAFENGESEYYEVSDFGGQPSFRYASVLRVKYGCLTCHGDPAGEVDETGYPKEGMQFDDVAGAVSIIMPMEQYRQEALSRTMSNVALFVALTIAIVVFTSIALHRWVTKPLAALSDATKAVASGRFNGAFESLNAKGEIADLAVEFSAMEQKLDNFYKTLEEQVRSRTYDLGKASETLEAQRDEIARINEQLVEANNRLKSENEYKSTFLATMSHELRTPLASIIAFTDLWLRKGTCKDEQDIALVNEIRRNSNELLTTINNTLDAASIEARRFVVSKTQVDLCDAANSVDAIVGSLAREKGVDLSIDVDSLDPVVVTDPNIVHKILVNLVSNAVKFTDSPGRVAASLVYGGEGRLIIRVSDTGIGIGERDLETIFDRFVQADSSTSRKYGGSGLGLSLVKEMAELLGGTVEAESTIGEGSVFKVTIPIDEREDL